MVALAGAPEGLATGQLAAIWKRRLPYLTHDGALSRAGLAMRKHAAKGNVARAGRQATGGNPAVIWVITAQGRTDYLEGRRKHG